MSGAGTYRKYRATTVTGNVGIRSMSPGFLIKGIAIDNLTAGWIQLSTDQWVPPYTTGWSSPVFPAAQTVDAQYSGGPFTSVLPSAGANDTPPSVYLFEEQVLYSSGYPVSPSSTIRDGIFSPATVSYGSYNYGYVAATGLWNRLRSDSPNTDGKAEPGQDGTLTVMNFNYAYNTNTGLYDRLKVAPTNVDAATVGVGGLVGLGLVSASLNYVFNGTTYDRVRGDTTQGMQVGLKRTMIPVIVESAANAAATLTLAAAGAGLFHYITHIRLTRYATAAIAGGARLAYTSTNLAGFTVITANLIAAGQMLVDYDAEHVHPIKSAVANTATTIIAPAIGAAGTTVMYVYYYTGP